MHGRQRFGRRGWRVAAIAAAAAAVMTAQAAPAVAVNYPAWFVVEVYETPKVKRTFHSPGQFDSHAEHNAWIKSCQAQHPGSSPVGDPRHGTKQGSKCGKGGRNGNTKYGYGIQDFDVPTRKRMVFRSNKKVNNQGEGDAWVAKCRQEREAKGFPWEGRPVGRPEKKPTGSPCLPKDG
ncbi:hypothetical protein [Saccharothrix australiensis]|uniref:Uncharacterized protein n=1 Tax=Saccharothrix australiensis TaxID=2072 RepID=A0A495VZ69_9PSEU|nr:hypothetical protein [Saccharothrix australiensis]RKT53675.1 hypothetical protein C8E97_2254 [Saccharothrix australiensis]